MKQQQTGMKRLSMYVAGLFTTVAAFVPRLVLALDKPAAGINFKLENPLGVSTVQDFLLKIIDAMVLIVSPIIVIMFIYSGFLFVQGSVNEEAKTKAKNTLLYTVIGAAVILGAKALALAIQNTVTQF
jgi:hypothetical protein